MQNPEDLADYRQNTIFLYMTLYNIAQRRSKEAGIPFPSISLSLEDLRNVDPLNWDDMQGVMDNAKEIIRYLKETGLGPKSSPEEREALIEENFDADNPEGAFLREIMARSRNFKTFAEKLSLVDTFLLIEESKNELAAIEETRKEVIAKVAKEIEKAGFPVDGQKLITNYMKAYEKDKKEAFKILTTNPAMFAPLQMDKAKKGLFGGKPKPEEGHRINKELGRFLKHLKI